MPNYPTQGSPTKCGGAWELPLPPLYGDESYQGAPAKDFDGSRSEAVLSFRSSVSLSATAPAAASRPSATVGAAPQQPATSGGDAGALWSSWATAAAEGSRNPVDFGFLLEASKAAAAASAATGSTPVRDRSRSPSGNAQRQPRRGSITPTRKPVAAKGSSKKIARQASQGHGRPALAGSARTKEEDSMLQVSSSTMTMPAAAVSLDKTMLCKFWLKGRCTRDGACKFAHGEDEQRRACGKVPCRYHQEGGCRQGDSCWYAHAAVAAGNGKSSEDDDMQSEGIFTAASSPSVGPAPAPAVFAACSDSTIVPEAAGSQDKTLLCKFWMKGRCSRKGECKFAHGEEEQRQACKAHICKFHREGFCSQGATCWYSHDCQEASTARSSTASTASSTSTSSTQSLPPPSPKRLPAPSSTAGAPGPRRHRAGRGRKDAAAGIMKLEVAFANGAIKSGSPRRLSEKERRRLWSDICEDDDETIDSMFGPAFGHLPPMAEALAMS
eukprot:TRINITY_DN90798_c0_g1_i1.p1 TRINITY_DN90798_c0_g1~~TRINITY_DN90798_c0_g1_i1.p1  ORF type:complete len:525 (-),score=91.59 TRINITY_DN90798_c0_g1_i1:156-1646(-)